MAARETRITRQDEARYLKEASAWDRERDRELQESRRIAWWVAIACLGLALIEATALALLVPLKTVEGYVVRVDTSTGIVDQLVRIRDASASYDEIVTKYFLNRVIQLREGYSRGELQSHYDESMLFTAPDARPALKASFAFDNPNGPYRRYGELGSAEIRVLTIAFIDPHLAQVRYARLERRAGVESTSRWVATIGFRYVASPATEEARAINPLGFQVTSYRNDPEAVLEDPRS